MVIRFAKAHGLAILADEVYQENVYRPGSKFVSFAKVLCAKGITVIVNTIREKQRLEELWASGRAPWKTW